ncbi:hypothetical protein THMIRHAS_04360 [Thiosulfatimonas sediminis]|uniref:Ubiquinone biosynthesis accessory factor UbiJ n=1 Tax=Thiosulfatimonas sediminis TaxID=2675054 RepID=A0A6F8PSF7_9GAMM|nr:SCP2 sterol-binding domain-containing protein [Thiosulfatimonas sediminis]BBP45063.1 hypothetical protein THMIRHAS_04360 [Thiosulfatimonas sediminis]
MSADFSRTAALLAYALESALQQARKLDIEHGQAFDKLPTGRVIELHIAPLKTPLYCLLAESQISVQSHLSGAADASITAPASAWLGLAADHPKLDAFHFDGERALGEQFLNALAHIEIDWEEHLASLTGDFIAFKVGHGVRSYLELKRRQRASIEQTLKEYLQFEINAVPTPSQVRHFNQDVTQLSQDLEQLDARIHQLIKRHTPV